VKSERATVLLKLFDRLRSGDAKAAVELIGLWYGRLRRLAGAILHRRFPRIAPFHDASSVLHRSLLRLLNSLHQEQPACISDFIGFSALQIRRELLDLARRQARQPLPVGDGRDEDGEPLLPDEPADTSGDPAKLAMWSEFHRGVDRLPAEERRVVDMLFYNGLSQREAAATLSVPLSRVQRLWVSALRGLPDCLPHLHKAPNED